MSTIYKFKDLSGLSVEIDLESLTIIKCGQYECAFQIRRFFVPESYNEDSAYYMMVKPKYEDRIIFVCLNLIDIKKLQEAISNYHKESNND